MAKNNLVKVGLFAVGLAGAVTTLYSSNGLEYPMESDKVERYHQMDGITQTLDKAVSQSYDINFGLDDLKMREALSSAYKISNQQLNGIAQDQEIKNYFNKENEREIALAIPVVGISLLSISLLSGIGLKLHEKNKKLLKEIKLESNRV